MNDTAAAAAVATVVDRGMVVVVDAASAATARTMQRAWHTHRCATAAAAGPGLAVPERCISAEFDAGDS